MSDPAEARDSSRTALGVAALRAAHQRFDGLPKILDDPIAIRMLRPGAEAWLDDHAPQFHTRRSTWLRAHVVLRSRYAEDRLADAAARGVRQYVLLGAGFETFGYRQPPWARALTMFEVDQAATQQTKRERLQAAGIDVPANVVFVPVDFERELLAARLAACGFDRSAPAFLSWLGVTMYLEEAAIDAVLAFVASLPRGSELVFTFSPERTSEEASWMADALEKIGEPLRTRFSEERLTEKLHRAGFSTVEFLSADAAERYFANRTDGLVPARRTTIARATV